LYIHEEYNIGLCCEMVRPRFKTFASPDSTRAIPSYYSEKPCFVTVSRERVPTPTPRDTVAPPVTN